MSVIWVKQAASDGDSHIASFASSIITLLAFLWTIFTMWQMFHRLHTWNPASSKLALSATQRAQKARAEGLSADEFYVDEHVRQELFKRRQEQLAGRAATENSSLLASAMPCGVRDGKM